MKFTDAKLQIEGAAKPPFRFSESIVDLIRRDMPELPCWIGPALLPKGGKALVGGEAKIGKTFIGLEMGRALATGKALFHSATFTVEQCRTLYIDQEVGEDGLRKRSSVSLAEEDLDALAPNFHYLSKTPGLHLDKPEGLDFLLKQCEHYRPNVLILDPASRLLDGEDNDNKVVRHFWENIDKLMKAHKEDGLSTIVFHHYRKPPQDDLDLDDDSRYDPYNFRGASEWPGAPDTVFSIVRPARLPGESEWLIGGQYVTRHGVSGDRIYLKVAPNSPRTVYEIPSFEANAILEEMRATRAASEAERKAKSKRGGRSREPETPYNTYFGRTN